MAITRRDFLAASLGTSTLVALGGGVPAFLARTARGRYGEPRRPATRSWSWCSLPAATMG